MRFCDRQRMGEKRERRLMKAASGTAIGSRQSVADDIETPDERRRAVPHAANSPLQSGKYTMREQSVQHPHTRPGSRRLAGMFDEEASPYLWRGCVAMLLDKPQNLPISFAQTRANFLNLIPSSSAS